MTAIMAAGDDVGEGTDKLQRAADKNKQLDQVMVN
jgi:hypothetical protein